LLPTFLNRLAAVGLKIEQERLELSQKSPRRGGVLARVCSE
jgi:hypothetical protein